MNLGGGHRHGEYVRRSLAYETRVRSATTMPRGDRGYRYIVLRSPARFARAGLTSPLPASRVQLGFGFRELVIFMARTPNIVLLFALPAVGMFLLASPLDLLPRLRLP